MRNGRKSDDTRILYVAYPLLPVNENSAGGAEQVLWSLQRELVLRGYRITVAACSGSEVSASVYSTGNAAVGRLSSARLYESRHSTNCLELLRVRKAIGTGFRFVHDHSGSFFTQAHKIEADVPVLATLHLPRSFYPADYFRRPAENVYFNCVSKSQAKTFSDLPNMIGNVDNGIDLKRFTFQQKKSNYLLWLGRICEEKGTHLALDAAEQAGIPIIIAGTVYPFAYHHDYFENMIVPRLKKMKARTRLVQSPDLKTKVELLQNARALLLTSSAEETSSLVAMEAGACGTPVIAMKRGALPEIVRHGETGLLARSNNELVSAIEKIGEISPVECRRHAEKYFSATRMANDYQNLYAKMLKHTVEIPRRVAQQPLAA